MMLCTYIDLAKKKNKGKILTEGSGAESTGSSDNTDDNVDDSTDEISKKLVYIDFIFEYYILTLFLSLASYIL